MSDKECIRENFARRGKNQPEREVNREGRKREEKGQKIAEGTERVPNFAGSVKMLVWLPSNLI
jgi:hypothetical protein